MIACSGFSEGALRDNLRCLASLKLSRLSSKKEGAGYWLHLMAGGFSSWGILLTAVPLDIVFGRKLQSLSET